MAGSSGGIGTEGPTPSSPVTHTKPTPPPGKGEFESRTVTPETGERVTPKSSHNGPEDKNIRDRNPALPKQPAPFASGLGKLAPSQEVDITGEGGPTDEEIDQILKRIQNEQKQRSQGSTSPDSTKPAATPKPHQQGTEQPRTRPEVPLATPDSENSSQERDPLTGQLVGKPVVNVSGKSEAESMEKPEKKEDPVPEIPAKKGFAQKYKKELGVAVGGGGLVLGGAVAAVFFPPAGLLVYSCGVMMLSMSLSKMMFALEGDPENLPKQKPDDPKNEPDDKKTPPESSDADKGKFIAVKKNVLDALKESGFEPPVDELGQIDREKAKAIQDELKRRAEEARQEIEMHPGGADLVSQIEKAVNGDLTPDQVIMKAVAKACAGDQGVNSDHVAQALKPLLDVAENAELMTGDMPDNVREAKIKEALAELGPKLTGVESKALERLQQALDAALQTPVSKATGILLKVAKTIVDNEIGRRASAAQPAPTIPQPPSTKPLVSSAPTAAPVSKPVAAPSSGGGNSPVSSATLKKTPSTSTPALGATTNDKLVSGTVLLQVFNRELSGLPEVGKMSDEDKEKLLGIAKAVESKLRKTADPTGQGGVQKISEQEFLAALKQDAGAQFKDIVEKVQEARSKVQTGLSELLDKNKRNDQT